ncbi:MAG TPA: PhnD/SsuA/transferrin family substrate-binding protein [Wenzhouxiangellaceae bacterium]|nr:PhnD/SsuA/transferrin family substrate-binding protein [Wenzhouxiangellaceae bacterium]
MNACHDYRHDYRQNHAPVGVRMARWAVFLLLASSMTLAQDPGEQAAAMQEMPAAVEETIAEGQAGEPGTTPDVPVQSLTGPLELLVNPEYPPEQARLVFQPLVAYLNDVTGLEITLAVDRNFHRYWLNARRNEAPPLVLEDAHMAAWRMVNFDYQPLVAAAAPKTFSLLTTGALADDSLDDFVGRRISSLPSPSLGYLVLADWFENPLQQPLILSTATSWLDAVEMVFSAEADAAIAPNNLVARYPNLYPVATSIEFPGLTLSASSGLPADVRQTLIDAMTTLHEDETHHAALFELDIDRFVRVDPESYEGLEDWLSTIFAL